MPVSTNTSPYYDDFSEDKNFYRILFRPGFAVQARELTQLQTMLQKQIERFGKHVFHEGSPVIDGQTTINLGDDNGNGAQYIKLENTVDGTASGSNVYVWNAYSNTTTLGKEIQLQTEPSGDNRSPRAKVIVASSWEGSDSPTLIVNYSTGIDTNTLGGASGGHFQAGDLIKSTDGTFTAKVLTPIVANTEVGASSVAGIANGVFFTKGYFAHATNQKLILEKYSSAPTYKIGLTAKENIIAETSDSSLYDNAQGYNASIAPGAHRLNLTLTLSKQSDLDAASVDFFELMRIKNGTLRRQITLPVYNEVEKTLALRTDEQSGSYTVHPFGMTLSEPPRVGEGASANTETTNYLDLTLSPGTAYVRGHRVKTIAPTTIEVDKGRDQEYQDANLITDYGGYLLMSNVASRGVSSTLSEQKGLFSPTANTVVDIHCVKRWRINGTAANRTPGYYKSLIGQARLMDITRSGLSTTNQNSIYRFYLSDFVANSIPLEVQAAGATSNGVYLFDAGEMGLGAGAYTGGTLKFETGICAGNTATIVKHETVGSEEYLEFDPPIQPFSAPADNDDISITMGLVHANSVVATLGGVPGAATLSITNAGAPQSGRASADVDKASKGREGFIFSMRGRQDERGNTIFNDSLGSLVYPISNRFSTSNVNSITYFGRRTAVVAAAGNGLTLTLSKAAMGMESDEEFTSSDWRDYTLQYLTTGQQFDANTVETHGASISTFSTSSVVFTFPASARVNGSEPILVTAPVKVSSATRIQKILKIGKTTDAFGGVYGQSTWGQNEAGTGNPSVVAQAGPMATNRSNGHIVFIQPNKIPGGSDNLGMPDVFRIRKVIDSLNQNMLPTNTMINDTAGTYDITNKYELITGQTDKLYDYSSLRLKAGVGAPTGQTIAIVDYFTASDASGVDKGFFDVGSYTTSYSDIPSLDSPVHGAVNLRNCIDFRPRVKTLTNDIYAPATYSDHDIGSSSGTTRSAFLPQIDGVFSANVGVYLPRIDKVVLRDDLTFDIIRGKSSRDPITPADQPNAMTLAKLAIPSYTFSSDDVTLSLTENKRYTMKDIGKLDKRIKNLEYYTSLNLLEKATADLNIVDDDGETRFKNGILVDSFAGHSVGDVSNPGYMCSIDPNRNELRAPYMANTFELIYQIGDNPAGSGIKRVGRRVLLDYTTTPFMTQTVASHAISTNPFQVVTYNGSILLDPTQDIWQDITTAPTVHRNLSGDSDALLLFQDAMNEIHPLGTVFDAWQTVEGGITVDEEITVGSTRWSRNRLFATERIETTTITDQTRSGVSTNWSIDSQTTNLGTYVIDSNIVPFIRSRGVGFIANGLRSNTAIYPYFDNVSVKKWTARANVLHFNRKPHVDSNTGTWESIKTVNTWSYGTATAYDAQDDNTLFIVDADGTFNTGDALEGVDSGQGTPAVFIEKYEHYSGTANTAGSPASNQIQLQEAAANTKSGGYPGSEGAFATTPGVAGHATECSALGVAQLIGQRVYIVAGTGNGQSRIITSFSNTTSIATLDSAWGTTPDTTSTYSIGDHTTNKYGRAVGVFTVPNEGPAGQRFSSGTKIFKLTDSINNEPALSTTRASAQYHAQGVHVTKADLTVDSLQIGTTETEFSDTRRLITTSVREGFEFDTGQRRDPLAQTFYVDPDPADGYPSGIYVDSVDLWFKDIDSGTEDISVQIRTTINSVPTEEVLREKRLFPSEVNRSFESQGVYPSPANTSTMTTFKFDEPVYLSSGADYAIVVISDSVEYTAYIATQGLSEIGTSGTGAKNIDKQAHSGALFKSQNGAIWTEDQTSDLMFRINRCVFPTNQAATLTLRNAGNTISETTGRSNALGIPIHYDLGYVTMGETQASKGTALTYSLQTTPSTKAGIGLVGGGSLQSAQPISIDENIYFTNPKQITNDIHGSARVVASLITDTDHVSPTIDLEGATLKVVTNHISNTSLAQSSFLLSNSLAVGFDNTDIVMVTDGGLANATHITSSPITNAVGTIVTNPAGQPIGVNISPGPFTNMIEHWNGSSVSRVSVTTNAGKGYYQTPTATIVQNAATNTTTFGSGSTARLSTAADYQGGLCTISVVGETSSEGGYSSSKVRYISRQVNLQTGFDATDLRVYVNAYKSANTDIQVYLKVQNEEDPAQFGSDLNWKLMRQVTPYSQSVSRDEYDYREIEFAAPEGKPNSARYERTLPDGQTVVYGDFKKFAVKICMWSNNSIEIPKVRDLRAIALDS
tara:strand:- start:13708 stop:20376 length:6669 start_codon:yes stop_codon:yes gene_type:complete